MAGRDHRLRQVGLALAGGLAVWCGVGLWALARWSDSRAAYQPILGLYNTGFLVEYAQAQRQGASWVTQDREVATRFVRAVDFCPARTARRLTAEPGQAVWIIEDTCVAGMFRMKNRRIDLVQTSGRWVVVWAGIKFKCAYTTNDPGNQLLRRNPFRQSRLPVFANLNQAVQSAAPHLNLWRTNCP